MRTCVVCGCTDEQACQLETGELCAWAMKYLDGTGICTFCAADDPDAVDLDEGSQLILPGDPEFHL